MSDDYLKKAEKELSENRKNARTFLCDNCDAINSSILLSVDNILFQNKIRLCGDCREKLIINRKIKIEKLSLIIEANEFESDKYHYTITFILKESHTLKF